MQKMIVIFRHLQLGLALAYCAIILVACDNAIVDKETPRSFVTRVTADTKEERDEIASELVKGSSKAVRLAGPLALKERGGIKPATIDFGWVSTTGTLVVYSKSYEVLVVLEPTVSSDVVKWTCVAYPPSARPNVC